MAASTASTALVQDMLQLGCMPNGHANGAAAGVAAALL